jgi:enoyl-CoA hydratase
MTGTILCRIEAGLCTLTLNRPEKLNALDVHAFTELSKHLDTIERQRETHSIGCIVLCGAGRSFCAGHDMSSITTGHEGNDAKRLETGTLERLAELDIPIVAAVQGHCLTGGLELVLVADIIVAAESARFADTHGRWDLVPVWGLSQRLPRRIGRARALEMMLTSKTYTGRQSEAIGIANLCVPDPELDAAVQAITADILSNAWRANRAVKKLFRETDGMTLRGGIAYELHHTAGRGPEMEQRIARWRKR